MPGICNFSTNKTMFEHKWRCGAVALWRSGAVAPWRSGAVAQWRCGAARVFDIRLREPSFESWDVVSILGQVRSDYVASVQSTV